MGHPLSHGEPYLTLAGRTARQGRSRCGTAGAWGPATLQAPIECTGVACRHLATRRGSRPWLPQATRRSHQLPDKRPCLPREVARRRQRPHVWGRRRAAGRSESETPPSGPPTPPDPSPRQWDSVQQAPHVGPGVGPCHCCPSPLPPTATAQPFHHREAVWRALEAATMWPSSAKSAGRSSRSAPPCPRATSPTPSWKYLGRSWGCLGPSWGPLRRSWGCLGPSWAENCQNWGQ